MRLALTLFICLSTGFLCQAQYVYTINADTVKITNSCDSAELILQNHTQGVPGFLFNTGNGRTAFQRILTQISSYIYRVGADTLNLSPGWGLTGNAGTSASSNFLGTTDAVPFDFRVNNTFSGTIDPVNFNTAFGGGAFYIAYTGGAGTDNTAIGANALNRTTGTCNVALGLNADASITSGQYNIALGTDAIEQGSTGTGNIGIGYLSLGGLSTGSQNVAIGHSTGFGLGSGSNNIAIGYGLRFPKDTSDQLLIGDSYADWIYGIGGLIGINTVTPEYTLDVNGQANTNILSVAVNTPYTAGDSALYWNSITHKIEMGSPETINSFNGIGLGAPTVSIGSGAGSGASISIEGSNEGGLITLTTGTSPSASATILTITYSTAFPNNSYPLTGPDNVGTATLETSNQATYLSASASGFSLIGSTTALTASTTYKWYYTVTGK